MILLTDVYEKMDSDGVRRCFASGGVKQSPYIQLQSIGNDLMVLFVSKYSLL
jgi:hypothetical protein